MPDNENKQWFEQSEKDREKRRGRTGGKKPAGSSPKAPADPSRRKRAPERGTAPAGKRPNKPAQPSGRPNSAKRNPSAGPAVPPKDAPADKSHKDMLCSHIVELKASGCLPGKL